MSSDRPAPLSSINTLKRDWSTDAATGPPRPPRRILSEAELKASRARRIEIMEAAMSGPSGASGSNKRSSGSDSIDPPTKRRPPPGAVAGDIVSTSEASDKNPATISVAAQITLSPEQQEILRLVTEGKNIFFTGSAGKHREP